MRRTLRNMTSRSRFVDSQLQIDRQESTHGVLLYLTVQKGSFAFCAQQAQFNMEKEGKAPSLSGLSLVHQPPVHHMLPVAADPLELEPLRSLQLLPGKAALRLVVMRPCLSSPR